MNAAVQAPEVKLFGIAATPAAKQSPRHGEVEALLTEAGQFASSMMTKIRTAAKIASETFVADAGVKDNVENAMAEYAKVLRDIDDHNVKANFNSALWVLAAELQRIQVSVPQPHKPGTARVEKSVPAGEVINMSKHVLRDAAKQVREQVGAARAPGAGRPAAQAPAAVPAAAQPTFFDQLEERLSDPGDFARIVAAIEKRGYRVTRSQQQIKASVTPDATAALAQALVDTVPATAIQQAAAQAAKGSKSKQA